MQPFPFLLYSLAIHTYEYPIQFRSKMQIKEYCTHWSSNKIYGYNAPPNAINASITSSSSLRLRNLVSELSNSLSSWRRIHHLSLPIEPSFGCILPSL
jgi:hypothetical protein